MIAPRNLWALENALGRQASVDLIGPRRAGKTTLALGLGEARPSIYLDLESGRDREKLCDPWRLSVSLRIGS